MQVEPGKPPFFLDLHIHGQIVDIMIYDYLVNGRRRANIDIVIK